MNFSFRVYIHFKCSLCFCAVKTIVALVNNLCISGYNNESMECEIKLEPPGSPDREGGKEMEMGKGNEDSEDVKKKKRKPYRPGIGPTELF